MVKVSFATASGSKLTSRVMVPPPAKSPDTVRASVVSLSSPTSSVPPAATLNPPAVRVCVPDPNEICAPERMLIVSQPLSFDESSAAVRSWKARVLWSLGLLRRSKASIVPAVSTPVALKVRSRKLSDASLISPVMRAPSRTTTCLQPLIPWDWIDECRLPEVSLPLKVSVSTPAPPYILLTSENVALENVRLSSPSPRLIWPETVAPAMSTVASPP